MAEKPGDAAIKKMQNFVEKYCEKSGTFTHPTEGVTEQVVFGLSQVCRGVGPPALPVPVLPG